MITGLKESIYQCTEEPSEYCVLEIWIYMDTYRNYISVPKSLIYNFDSKSIFWTVFLIK